VGAARLAIFAALLGIASAANAAATLAPNVLLVPGTFDQDHQPDGNSVVFATPRGLIVVDTGRHPAHSAAIEAVSAKAAQPVIAIINTHWHLDHVSGNPRLRKAAPGLKVYASSAIDGALTGFLADSRKRFQAALAAGKVAPEELAERRADAATIDNGAALKPDVVIDATRTLAIGGRTLDIHYAADAATAGDLWIFDPKTAIVITGDLVTLPAPFLDTACPQGWSRALGDIAAVSFTRLVPGHGPVMSRDDFARYRQAFTNFVDCARSTADTQACSAGWAKDIGPLLPAGEQRLAEELTSYYVTMLRANGGRSASCNQA
jgi:glyoxylase-like metal-dependent hydrolase (beta-lactamase superfamily II)